MKNSEYKLVPYSPVIKSIFYAEMLVGALVVAAFLWMGEAVIPKTLGGDVYTFDRVKDPYFFWGLIVGIFYALVALPIWYLSKTGTPRR